MAKNMPSNTVPKAMVVRNEFFSEGMAKPDTGTVPSTLRQAAEGASHHISGQCEENKDNDENLSDTSDAAAENIQTIDIGPGEFDTYAIAYICKEQTLRMKKAVEETKNKHFQNLPAAASNSINDANDVLHALNPNLMYMPNVQHPAAHAKDHFWREGKRTWKISADNEIFVTDCDWNNQRVQVFSINGTYLRLFPTVVPGESKTTRPYVVALNVAPGYLWVLGKSSRPNEGHVVQFSKYGQPIKKFDVSLKSVYPVIAMDVRNNKIIVGDKNTIMMFDPGQRGGGQLDSFVGIFLDTSGHIIVANEYNLRVDMFTSQGKFVRTIADISQPWGVAMGPCGELVLTSPYTNTVTIFPRHMVLP
ncbi:PREDICTED: E3 ubiquitin-protein ligase TRIM71-like [Branchiostoma belcheri]|uniref:E3 ubiquitin-protein ligase TRIM71-like n=1 Tax=Branchiostoma belcheri TaxID=7741 RepID=A0A6P4ZRQ6_BRABE|nr:PREDICTED: E3 ubiquitin-protein ligase TRIM71-like [Branchiostoma belcheri]